MRKLTLPVLLAALFARLSYAHPQPATTIVLDVEGGHVRMNLHLPLSELEPAFGHQPMQRPEALRQYLLDHVRPVTTIGQRWSVEVGTMAVAHNAGQQLTGPFQEVIVNLVLVPPPGANPRDFVLRYDAILHQVVTHKALVSIHSDWASGRVEPAQVGVIAVNTGTARVEPFAVHLGEGSWWTGFRAMLGLGIEHIREGTDHLLFLLVLLLPATLTLRGRAWGDFGGVRYSLLRLLTIVTAFTLGHSITLLAGALHWLTLPQQPVEILIACSILISAIHAIRPLFPGREAQVAAGFGLVHGLAFASVLSGLKLSAGPLALSIFGFNLGIELMQLLVIALTAPWLILLSLTAAHRWVRVSGALLSAVAACGWILNRVTGTSNAIERLMEAAPAVAPLALFTLALIATLSYLHTRLPKLRLLIPASAAMLVAVAADLVPTHPLTVASQAVSSQLRSASSTSPATVSDVVAKALAFKALLTTTQQQALEQTYTTTLARRWSNLPCAGTCRNGIQLGSLTAEQLAAALEVIKAAEGTAAGEGSDEFNQIRMADTVLANAQGTGGGGPGGLSYGEGIYYLAFLNTPSTTGPWMLQFGGHHYGANIAYNQGHVVATTPLFEALEPTSFTVNGTTYTPLAQEHDALTAMLASLTSSQLAAAKLSQTFGDVTLSPGESNGGSGTFPTTKVGLAVSSLTAAQKQLVLEAMKPWVRDMDDTVAANLLAIYQSELDATFIAFTGSGTSGDASSFLNANTNYARIDGPGVWIEFACQSGVVFRNQIHYHTVWRDHVRDYGKDLSLTTPLDSSSTGAVTAVSAASFTAGSLAPEAIGTLFGTGLAASTVSASTDPLPTTLGDVQVQVRDAAGTTRNAPLFYVSPTQISFQNPAGATAGAATVTVLLNGATVGQGSTVVEQVTPGLFSANSSGQGVAAAIALRVKADGTQIVEPLIQLNSSTNKYEAVPLSVGEATDQLFLLAFGTGFRNRSSLSAVTATIGGASAEVLYAGTQGSFIGLDQANIRIPASLAGRGEVNVILTVDGKTSNTVTINVK